MSERGEAKRIGAKQHKNSGRNYTKGDASWNNYVLDFKEFTNSYVKVIVRSKTNPLWFDMFIENLEKNEVADIQVVDDHLHLDLEDDEDIVNEAEDTITILKKYVDGLNLQADRQRLEGLLQSLYHEALSIQ